MRGACVFCATALTDETRAPKRCPIVPSGFVTSNKSWCRDCDDATAPRRARALLEVERRARRREAHRAYMREYNARPEVQAAKRAHDARTAWRHGRTSFRCAGCAGRFPRQREAWRRIDGVRQPLGLCGFCAAERLGASRHDHKTPAGGWAAYLRARRARDKGTGSGKPPTR